LTLVVSKLHATLGKHWVLFWGAAMVLKVSVFLSSYLSVLKLAWHLCC
jgi:hypothetical protein